MSIYSLGHKEQKSQLQEIHTTFRSPDRGQNNKKVIDLLYRGQIFKLVQFQRKWAQFNWIVL